LIEVVAVVHGGATQPVEVARVMPNHGLQQAMALWYAALPQSYDEPRC
jgi:hypothetical protein